MKRRRLILGLVLVIVVAIGLIIGSYLTVPIKPTAPAPVSRPTPPVAVGCYRYNEAQVWVNDTCFSPSPAQAHDHPRIGDGVGILGIQSIPPPLSTSPPAVLTRAQVQVAFKTENGEFDTIGPPSNPYPTDSFSIQLNTNSFTGSNGDTDWVQFTFHASHAPGNASNHNWGVCVWEIDISTNNYMPYCYNGSSTNPIPAQILSSSYSITLEADITRIPPLGRYLLYAMISTNGQTFAVLVGDTYDLADNWLFAVGTLVGFMNGSEAIFYMQTVEDTSVIASSCLGGWSGCGRPLYGEIIGGGYALGVGIAGTLESNDLTYTKPIWPDTSTLSCSSGMCSLATEACFMGTGNTCLPPGIILTPITDVLLGGIIVGIAAGLVFYTVKKRGK